RGGEARARAGSARPSLQASPVSGRGAAGFRRLAGFGRGGGDGRHQRQTDIGADLVLHLARQPRIGAQELAHVVLALADLVAVVGVPRTRLVEDLVLHAEVDDLALARDALAVENVEVGFL